MCFGLHFSPPTLTCLASSICLFHRSERAYTLCSATDRDSYILAKCHLTSFPLDSFMQSGFSCTRVATRQSRFASNDVCVQISWSNYSLSTYSVWQNCLIFTNFSCFNHNVISKMEGKCVSLHSFYKMNPPKSGSCILLFFV